MKAPCSHAGRLFGGLVVVAVLSLALTPNLTAQTDPGPRPMGTSPFLDNGQTVCQLIAGGPFKFTSAVCDDFDQPPSKPPQPPAAGAGQLIANAGTLGGFWGQALTVFSTDATLTASVPPATIIGLGPSFNATSCFGCHAQPAVGGASPGIVDLGNGKGKVGTTNFNNPEVAAETADGSNNTPPCFLQAQGCGPGFPLGDFTNEIFLDGPVVEVRFPQGYPGISGVPPIAPVGKGAVAELFTFQGALNEPPGCSIGQEPITAQIHARNAIFRTPTPTFGLGFVENTPDLTLTQNAALNAGVKRTLGINPGVFNLSGNDQTITRFGWKAQNKSLLMFAGEASNVEMGVTNELFPNERTTGNGAPCVPLTDFQPEDEVLGTNPTSTDPSTISSVLQNNAVFMRLNAAAAQCDFGSPLDNNGAPTCNNLTAPALQGQCFFGFSTPPQGVNCAAVTGGLTNSGIGCVLCHSDSLTTGGSSQGGLSNFTYAPYSDFALHDLGLANSDGVNQGAALPRQFRTAPLWGAGQRLFFFHDGRYIHIDHAIAAHCPTPAEAGNEACGVIKNFNNLNPNQQQFILDFLRSL
jgi:CxxC motif-containing protein (DUF1111 family)